MLKAILNICFDKKSRIGRITIYSFNLTLTKHIPQIEETIC